MRPPRGDQPTPQQPTETYEGVAKRHLKPPPIRVVEKGIMWLRESTQTMEEAERELAEAHKRR